MMNCNVKQEWIKEDETFLECGHHEHIQIPKEPSKTLYQQFKDGVSYTFLYIFE